MNGWIIFTNLESITLNSVHYLCPVCSPRPRPHPPPLPPTLTTRLCVWLDPAEFPPQCDVLGGHQNHVHPHLAARDSAEDHLQQALTATSEEWRAALIQTHNQQFNQNPPSPPPTPVLFFWTLIASFCIGKVNKVPLPFVIFRGGESETSANMTSDH